MNSFWWQLPGPSRFVRRVVGDLRVGKNVVCCLPEHAPDRLAEAVRAALGDSEVWSWDRIDLSMSCPAQPIEWLFSRFVVDNTSVDVYTASTLAQSPTFAGRCIWIEGLRVEHWPAWKGFLQDYEHACRDQPLLERTLFCVAVTNDLAIDPPRAEIALAIHHWREVLDGLDMLLWVSSIVSGRGLTDLQKRVAIASIANLGLWDPLLCEALAGQSLADLFAPVPVLQEFAQARGWVDLSPAEFTWCRGMVDRVDGQEKVHSAVLSLHDPGKELQRRLWIAQVAVMFPVVEEARQVLLDRLAPYLKVPFHTDYGVINDPRDLEIGHIHNQICRNPKIDNGIKQRVRQLKHIRDSLAHIKLLTPGNLLI